MRSTLIQNATIINEGKCLRGDLLIKDEIIVAIGDIDQLTIPEGTNIINAMYTSENPD
jgi:dihydroorotase-like cyclic amidohydrolase